MFNFVFQKKKIKTKKRENVIKEIEKKDKRYQWAYYIIVAMLVGFLYYVSTTRKQMDLQADQIDVLTIKATDRRPDIGFSK